jgi:hypothetical protein
MYTGRHEGNTVIRSVAENTTSEIAHDTAIEMECPVSVHVRNETDDKTMPTSLMFVEVEHGIHNSIGEAS